MKIFLMDNEGFDERWGIVVKYYLNLLCKGIKIVLVVFFCFKFYEISFFG